VPAIQHLVDRVGHGHVGDRRVGPRHVRDQSGQLLGRGSGRDVSLLPGFSVVAGVRGVGVLGVARFAEVDLVAVPGEVLALGGPAGVGVIRGVDPPACPAGDRLCLLPAV
jgi:hypothetical protein